MCGIGGLLAPWSRDELDHAIRRMTETLVPRGPDAGGVVIEEGIALGHRRLSIIDLSESGAQPMSRDGTTLVYNGETYNFTDLRGELEARGCVFEGHSDTEVVLQCYNQWGLEGLSRLEGIFALALWDRRQRRLVLMRDRLGVKPLFYAQHGDALLFGSQIKTLFAGAPVDREVCQQAFAEYLWYGNAFEERTIYRHVQAVLPGHRIIVENGKLRQECWWKVEQWLDPSAAPQLLQDAATQVGEALDRAVGRQLVSDVPVCIFLSGGIDSSGIAAAAVAASAGQKLSSYAVGFDFMPGASELPKARAVAAHLGLDHNELNVRGGDLPAVIEQLVAAHDEPFGDAANIPLYLLARELRGTVKVALQGDGGDEMFAGYRRYALVEKAAWWRLWPHALEPLLRRLPGHFGRRLARLGASAGQSDAGLRMALLLTMETLDRPPTVWLEADARAQLDADTDPFAAFRACAARFSQCDPVQQMLLTDMTLQLPSQFLTKVDRATMAQGLESRVPLLDEHIVKLAVNLPSEFKVASGQRKIVLRDALRARIPGDILDGPKTGFSVPYGEWLRGPLLEFARGAILDPGFLRRFSLDAGRLERALVHHGAGRGALGFPLWKLLQLSLWSRSDAAQPST